MSSPALIKKSPVVPISGPLQVRLDGSAASTNDSVADINAAPRKGEMISLFPPDFDLIAAKTDDQKVSYIQSVLQRDEEEAIEIVASAVRMYGTAAEVVSAYLPMIREVKQQVCKQGRPRINKATGKRNRTWEEICRDTFHVSLRRMQQLLALDTKGKASGPTQNRKQPIDRKLYDRAIKVAEPAAKLSQAIVEEGLGSKFPDAMEVLKLAEIPIPSAKSVPANEDGVSQTASKSRIKPGNWSDLSIEVSKLCGKQMKTAFKGLPAEVVADAFGRFAQRLAQVHCLDSDGVSVEMRVVVEVVRRKPPTTEKEISRDHETPFGMA